MQVFSAFRTYGPSDLWTVGLVDRRTYGPSDLWAITAETCIICITDMKSIVHIVNIPASAARQLSTCRSLLSTCLRVCIDMHARNTSLSALCYLGCTGTQPCHIRNQKWDFVQILYDADDTLNFFLSTISVVESDTETVILVNKIRYW
jgi:hypothetical protein